MFYLFTHLIPPPGHLHQELFNVAFRSNTAAVCSSD